MAEHQVDAPRPQGMQEPEKKGHGCLFYGCLIAIALAIVLAIAAGGALFGYLKSFTSDTPMDIPVAEVTPGEYEALKARIQTFRTALDEGKVAEISLSAKDINTLIANDPEWSDLKGKAYVTIEGDEVKADASIPLDELPGFNGRYLNGTLGIKLSLQDGVLFVSPQTVVVKDKPLPAMIMDELRKQNFAEDACEDEKTLDTISKLKSIEVKDGKIVVQSSGAK